MIRPMPLWVSLLCFAIPSAAGWIGVYLGLPALEEAGMPVFWAFWLCITLPLAGMLVASLVGFRLEGHPPTWAALKRRFRLEPIQGRQWLWVLALVASIGLYLFLRQTVSSWLASLPGFRLPPHLPSILDPRVSQTSIPAEYIGVPLQGNWWILLVMVAAGEPMADRTIPPAGIALLTDAAPVSTAVTTPETALSLRIG